MLREWRQLSPGRRAVLPRALATVALVRACLSFLPYRRWRRVMDVLHTRARRAPLHGVTADDVGWAVRRAARVVPGASCLTGALAASLLLEAAGREARLHIGVRRPAAGGLEAHAWLESENEIVVGGGNLEQFRVLEGSASGVLAQPLVAHSTRQRAPRTGGMR